MHNSTKSKFLICFFITILIFIYIISFVIELDYERTRHIKLQSKNIYNMNFNKHWQQLLKELNLDTESISIPEISDLHIDYNQNGEIKSLMYQMMWQEGEKFYIASVDFSEKNKEVEVKVNETEKWENNFTMISGHKLFNKLNEISIEEMTPESGFGYYSLMFYGLSNFGIEDKDLFIVDGNKISPFKGELPIEGYLLKINGNDIDPYKNLELNSNSEKYYLLDI